MRRATEVTVVLLGKMAIVDIREKFKLTVDFGHDVPPSHQPVITRQACVDLADKQEDKQYCESVVPALVQSDVDHIWDPRPLVYYRNT